MPIPRTIKIIPPINSHFQATINNAVKIKEGIRCINKLARFCQKVFSDSNESAANILTKRMDKMQRILGVQCINLIEGFISLTLSLFFINA